MCYSYAIIGKSFHEKLDVGVYFTLQFNMGRTFRNRKRRLKSSASGYSAENDVNIISMNQFIHKNSIKKMKRLKLFVFPETGRGVMALDKVESGDVLLEVPFNLILSIYTLDLDIKFKEFFFSNSVQIGKIKNTFSCQQLLAFYVCFIKLSLFDSIWSNYIKTIPSEFAVPYFSHNKHFTNDVLSILEKQKYDIENGYKNLTNYILRNNKHTLSFQTDLFTLNLFGWAYFAVNSRCVFLNPDIVRKVTSSSNNNTISFLEIINDDPNLGLIPFLDMFNHSPHAKTDACLEFNDESNSPVFKLSSLSDYNKHQQIFIFYGEHTNLKLFTEYGFCIPLNPFSNIPIFSEELISVLGVSKEKYQYITKHELFKNLYIDYNGLSYNLIRFLYILSNSNKSKWDTKIYSTHFSEVELAEIHKLINPLLSNMLNNFVNSFCVKNYTNMENDIYNAYDMLINECVQLVKMNLLTY